MESCLLGSLILGDVEGAPGIVADAMAGVCLADFYRPAHGVIFETIAELRREGVAVECPSLLERLRQRGQLENIGGVDYLMQLAESVPTAANAGHYADQVRRLALARRAAEHYERAIRHLCDEPMKLAEVLEEMRVNAETVSARLNSGELAVAPGSQPTLVSLADVKPEPVEWLWYQRVAIGKLTMLVGDPGLGKTFVTMDMAARVSSGKPWPNEPSVPNPARSVVIMTAEDSLSDTIRPRLDAHGADVTRIKALTAVKRPNGSAASFDLTRDIARCRACHH
jgi:hypothetical protein